MPPRLSARSRSTSSADDVDLLSLSAHKFYGPKGIGALYVRRRDPQVRLEPLFDGGGHERGFRSGTLPVPLVVGLGVAVELAVRERAEEARRLLELRERLHEGIARRVPAIRLNGHPTIACRATSTSASRTSTARP